VGIAAGARQIGGAQEPARMGRERDVRPRPPLGVAAEAAEDHDHPPAPGIGEAPEVPLHREPVRTSAIGGREVGAEGAVATEHQFSLTDAGAGENADQVSEPVPSPLPTVAPPVVRGRLGLWYQSLRAPSLLTSVVPATAGGLAAIGSAHPDWGLLAVALVALLFVHAGTNISNDVEDTARGIDPADKVRRNSQVYNTGLLSIAQGRRLYGACFAIGMLLGIVICVVQGPALLAVGMAGLLGGLLYTAGPAPYKYAGLGEAVIIFLMGPLMTQGVYTAVTGSAFAATGFWVGIGPGLLIACVLLSNNLDDLDDDRAAGARTLAVRVGFPRARTLYATLMVFALVAPIALWVSGLFDAWILLPLLVAGPLLRRAREVAQMRDSRDPALATLTPRTAEIHLMFAVLLCVSVALARI
jgi:1,4-dihydroxy-2-naphthoate octaprenyltransferase